MLVDGQFDLFEVVVGWGECFKSQGYGCLILKLSEEVLVRCMVNGERVRMLIGMPRAPPGDHGGAKGLQAAQWLKRIDLGRMCHDWDQRTIERVSIRDLACA